MKNGFHLLFTILLLAFCAAISSSCSTAGGGTGGTGTGYAFSPDSVRTATKLAAFKILQSKPEHRATAEAVSLALTKVTTDGLTAADVATFLAQQLSGTKDGALYVEVALSFVPVNFSTLAVRNQYLTAAAEGLKGALALTATAEPFGPPLPV